MIIQMKLKMFCICIATVILLLANYLGMKQPIIILVIVVLVESTSVNYPNCVDCPEGEVYILVNTCI